MNHEERVGQVIEEIIIAEGIETNPSLIKRFMYLLTNIPHNLIVLCERWNIIK